MGINDRANEERQNKRQKAKAARSRRASSAGTVEWSGFDWTCVIALVEALAENGGACRIGATRDGGAWALGIYMGDDYATEYVRPSEDFQAAINEIATAWLAPSAATRWWERVIQLREAGAR